MITLSIIVIYLCIVIIFRYKVNKKWRAAQPTECPDCGHKTEMLGNKYNYWYDYSGSKLNTLGCNRCGHMMEAQLYKLL